MGYEITISENNSGTGYLETQVVSESSTVTISGVDFIKLKVEFPFFNKPTNSMFYKLFGYIDATKEYGGEFGYTNTNQSSNITSLNYQVKLDSTAVDVDDYYIGYKITLDVDDSGPYKSIYGTVTDYDGTNKVISISQTTYGSGIQWTEW